MYEIKSQKSEVKQGDLGNIQFKREVSGLCNKYGLDNMLNTPDFLLGEAIYNFLTVYHNLEIGKMFHRGINESIEEAKKKQLK